MTQFSVYRQKYILIPYKQNILNNRDSKAKILIPTSKSSKNLNISCPTYPPFVLRLSFFFFKLLW